MFGCGLYEKKYESCLRATVQQTDKIILVQANHFKSAPVELLRQKLKLAEEDTGGGESKELTCEKENPLVGDGITRALQFVQQTHEGSEGWAVIVCGSLFVVAEGRAHLASLVSFPPHDWVHSIDSFSHVYK